MTIDEYYKLYLRLHQNKNCRRLHFVGQCVTIVFTIIVLYNWYWWLVPFIPFVIYPFAWLGHFFFEKNTPAAFSNPIKAKICDWLMFRDILLGRISL
jgi:hypothetical protein